MNLHQLHVLVALIDRGSYTAAAEHLHLTQPAVSQQVKALETSCGVRLVERANNRVLPTHAGEVLYKYALSMLHIEQEALHALEDLKAGGRGRFVVGANTTGGMYIVPPLLAAYREANPDTEIVLRIEGTEAILAAIASRSLEMGFVGGPVLDRRFRVEPLVPDRLVLIAAPSHRLARQNYVALEQLAEERFIVARYGSTTRRLIESKFKEQGITLRIG
ncbi:MAG: LysR substrate-binding domain-containing protein, partial [Chloroflexota bacterium]|nr:LysR substrate-binding domain-containing protein [Chloroflexota bacterium]